MGGYDRYEDYAKVWDGTKVIKFQVGSGYCDMTYRTHAAVVDATPEVLGAVKAYEAELARVVYEKYMAEQAKKLVEEKAKVVALQATFDAAPSRGERIMVCSNRLKKAKKGDTGTVFWKGVNKFNPDKISVGVEMDFGRKEYFDSTQIERSIDQVIEDIILKGP
jgi:hypothetical protein